MKILKNYLAPGKCSPPLVRKRFVKNFRTNGKIDEPVSKYNKHIRFSKFKLKMKRNSDCLLDVRLVWGVAIYMVYIFAIKQQLPNRSVLPVRQKNWIKRRVRLVKYFNVYVHFRQGISNHCINSVLIISN